MFINHPLIKLKKGEKEMKETKQQTKMAQAYVSPQCEILLQEEADIVRTSDIPVQWNWDEDLFIG